MERYLAGSQTSKRALQSPLFADQNPSKMADAEEMQLSQTAAAAAQTSEIIEAAMGSNITLLPKYSGDPSEITWKVNGNKLVDMKINDTGHVVFYGRIDGADIDLSGHLTIRNLTEEDSGIYKAEVMVNDTIQSTVIRITVLVPVSVPVLNVSCLPDGSAGVSCMVEAGTDPSIYLSVNEGAVGSYSSAWKRIAVTVPSPGPWDVICYVRNGVSRMETNKTQDTCPGADEGTLPAEKPVWSHFLLRGATIVMYTALLISMVADL